MLASSQSVKYKIDNNGKFFGKLKVSKFIKLLDLKIDIITENSTTKPPIINIVEIALEIDCAIISPRFDKLTFL